MKFKQLLAKLTHIPAEILPSSYQILGNIMLIKLLNPIALRQKRKIARAILKSFPYVKTVCLQKGIFGEFRQPRIEILAGTQNTETIHNELNCKFKLDVAKIMWSKGNHFERRRLLRLVKPNEIIIDMFAGIGYWSIILGKHTKAKKIIAIEKNPEAFDFLIENICLNKLLNITAIEGDCRFFIGEKADRILMGYFPNTIKFLPHALKLSKKGTHIHFHELTSDLDNLKKKISKFKELEIENIRKVKEYSPNKTHYVFDLKVT
ncbi:MAG: class I SAM-dependent methyltransferase family protein [Candidatus Nanoarchaeia archaeon]